MGPPFQRCSSQTLGLKYVSSRCTLGLSEAAKCIEATGSRRVVFIGDSIGVQMMYTLLCGLSPIDNRVPTNNPAMYQEENRSKYMLRIYKLPTSTPIEVIQLCSKPNSGLAGSVASSLSAAFDDQLLLEPAVWEVGFGLWHLHMKHAKAHGCENKEMMALYRVQLHQVLRVLNDRARGRIFFRETTAVHPSHMGPDVSSEKRRSFACMNNQAVATLNWEAQNVTKAFPRVTFAPGYFRATVNHADHLLQGDIRHYDGVVIQELLHVAYMHWCNCSHHADAKV